MRTIVIIACLFLAGCVIPETIYINHGYAPYGNIVEPLEQRGSGMSFMCRDAINRRDSGGTFIFCK